MANTLALRRRIKTAQNVSKTTRAMQMIAASKLKRAQEAAVSARPYVTKLVSVTQSLAPKDNVTDDSLSPYMKISKASGKTLYIVISPDKGLCGGLNTNLIREYLHFRGENSLFVTVGKKIENIAASNKNLIASFPFGNTLPSFAAVLPIIKIIDEYFLTGKVDNVKILTTHFNSVFSQSPKVTDFLPVKLTEINAVEEADKLSSRIYEPSQKDLLPALLKRYIEMVLFQHFLENYASFQAAQMIAMQNATNNAKDIVNALQLLYNKARQEKITKEILDITSAAVAMEQG